MILLENDVVLAQFSEKGAELQRLLNKSTGLDYLWKGDPAYWAKHSPVLFPIVGGLKEDSYFFDGKQYSLSRHGFARDLAFEFNKPTDNKVVFILEDTLDTYQVYPFKFRLELHYELIGASLTCTYRVFNPDEAKKLFFSLGAHPAFAVPISTDSVYEDYYLLFDKDEEIKSSQINQNLITDKEITLPLKNRKLVLTHDLFKNDALVLKHLQSEEITLKNTQNSHGLTFSFSQFPFFGIWAAPDADFVCLEPWCGIADSVNHNQQLMDKEGIESLSPGSAWERSWSVKLF